MPKFLLEVDLAVGYIADREELNAMTEEFETSIMDTEPNHIEPSCLDKHGNCVCHCKECAFKNLCICIICKCQPE